MGVLEGEGIFSHTLWMLLNRTGVKFSQSHKHVFQFSREFPLPNCRFNPFFCVVPKAVGDNMQ